MTEARRRRPASPCPGCNNELLLGEIKGTVNAVLENQKTQGAQLAAMDGRLRSVENKGAIAGAVSGLLMAVGVNLAGWWLKGKS